MDDSINNTSNRIEALPKDVVDRIAAGEVVQRPASVAKELLENSLDAQATRIEVQCQRGGLSLLSVSDNGCGMASIDLPLAATRFATSKLHSFSDLKQIRTFGFRGEALASASLVGKLTIVSKQKHKNSVAVAAYMCCYNTNTTANNKNTPKPCAGTVGTTVKVTDLFYNTPSRLRVFSKYPAEEYNRVLAIAQRYAIQTASRGVSISCRKTKSSPCDLNTQSIPSLKALQTHHHTQSSISPQSRSNPIRVPNKLQKEQVTRDVIGHIFGSSVAKQLVLFESQEGDVEAVDRASLESMQTLQRESNKDGDGGVNGTVCLSIAEGNTVDSSSTELEKMLGNGTQEYAFAYRAHGLVTREATALVASGAFILFINDRLVECGALKRSIEAIYAQTSGTSGNTKNKPFVYLHLELPGCHVDVNVHPTKNNVAILHEDRLCHVICQSLHDLLVGGTTVQKSFPTQTLLTPTPKSNNNNNNNSQTQTLTTTPPLGQPSQLLESDNDNEDDEDTIDTEEASPDKSGRSHGGVSRKRKIDIPATATTTATTTTAKRAYNPSRLVRTSKAAPAGALEPFLVSKLSLSQASTTTTPLSKQSTLSSPSQRSSSGMDGDSNIIIMEHTEMCEFYNMSSNQKSVDLSVPGAFASICRCQVERGTVATNNNNNAKKQYFRPKKVVPTQCAYSSIQDLRAQVTKRSSMSLSKLLREAVHVGALSRRRSLWQCGTDLVMVNHYDLARELFYQLALARFGEPQIASLGGRINVKVVLEQALQCEEDASTLLDTQKDGGDENDDDDASFLLLKASETNSELAQQAADCLEDKAEMLKEYYGISLESCCGTNGDNDRVLYLTGLPVLLEGHTPSPHALSIFLLRLATEVDWSEEESCFNGICTELAYFYAELVYTVSSPRHETDEIQRIPLLDEAATKALRHELFPAISYLLVPPKEFETDGTISRLAELSKLYKVFERC